jgi:hypothetical protein
MSRRIGDRSGIAYASLGLACLAADAGDWHRAAVLHGVAQAFLDPTGQPWEELEARYRQDSLAQARAHLGQGQFESAYSMGMALSPDDPWAWHSAPTRPWTWPPESPPSLTCSCDISAHYEHRQALIDHGPVTIQIGGYLLSVRRPARVTGCD